jgi:hypothetical protein
MEDLINENLTEEPLEELNEEPLEEASEESEVVEEENENGELFALDDAYESLIEEDLDTLRKAFPELRGMKDITELENPVRYGALRDLGLSPEEAYRASSTRRAKLPDNREHLRSSAPRSAKSPSGSMSYQDMEIARSIFTGVSDAEIQRLYKKVTR